MTGGQLPVRGRGGCRWRSTAPASPWSARGPGGLAGWRVLHGNRADPASPGRTPPDPTGECTPGVSRPGEAVLGPYRANIRSEKHAARRHGKVSPRSRDQAGAPCDLSVIARAPAAQFDPVHEADARLFECDRSFWKSGLRSARFTNAHCRRPFMPPWKMTADPVQHGGQTVLVHMSGFLRHVSIMRLVSLGYGPHHRVGAEPGGAKRRAEKPGIAKSDLQHGHRSGIRGRAAGQGTWARGPGT